MSALSTPTIYADDAELEHGWAPTTALADTVQRQSVLALAESTARPSELMGARSVRDDDLVAMWRPPTAGQRTPPTTLHVERVTDTDGIDEWARAAVQYYPLDATPAAIATRDLLAADDIHLHIGRAAGEPVAVSATVVACGTNAVALVATRPEARGRGYGRAITWAATTVRPELPATLLASDEGRPLYEHLGYLPHSRWTMWVRPHR